MNEQHDRDMRKLDEALAVLRDHFDTVQIFTTRHENDDVGVTFASRASGNFYTRYGQVKHWVIMEEEASRLKARRPED